MIAPRLYLLAACGLALLVACGVVVHLIRADATSDALQDITNRNTEAGNAADDDRSRFDACPSGMWDFVTGQCRRSAPRGGN